MPHKNKSKLLIENLGCFVVLLGSIGNGHPRARFLLPLPAFPVFLDKLDTYTRWSKSGAAGVIRNIVGIASSKERRCRRAAP
jgi:hypothetical protein